MSGLRRHMLFVDLASLTIELVACEVEAVVAPKTNAAKSVCLMFGASI